MAVKGTRFERALELIDAANRDDPVSVSLDGAQVSRTLADAVRVTRWLEQLAPGASEELRLAARAHHLRRWKHPRTEYPEGRGGYLRWRTALARLHAAEAGALLRAAGYGEDFVERVGAVIRKERLGADPEVQALEDAVCLVFLEDELAVFSGRVPRATTIGILRKSWRKMSPAGREAALGLALAPAERDLVREALEA